MNEPEKKYFCHLSNPKFVSLSTMPPTPSLTGPWPQMVAECVRYRSAHAKPAVVCGDITLTYTDLLQKAGVVRNIFKAQMGLNGNSRLMIAFADTPLAWVSFAVVQLAIAQMGACFTVMDTRSKSMSEEARAHVIHLFKPDILLVIGDVQLPLSHLGVSPVSLGWHSIIHSMSTDAIDTQCATRSG